MTRSNNILLWLSTIGAFFFVQSCNSPTAVQTVDYDMFPLRNGLQYKYSYNHIYIINDHKWVDSGSVEYLIKDSVNVSPIFRVWIISTNVDFLHQYYALTDQLGGMRLDSSYSTNYNATDTLKEILVDTHVLSCKSLVWQFPLSIFPRSPVPFARYSSSSDPILSYYSTNQSGPDNTVEHYSKNAQQRYVFEKDIGLKSASNDIFISSNVSYSSDVLSVTLLSVTQK